MKDEKKYLVIHFAFVTIAMLVMSVGFSKKRPEPVILAIIMVVIYSFFIKRWRKKYGIIREDERTIKQCKEIAALSFYVIFVGTLGFHLIVWILQNYGLASPKIIELGGTAGNFGVVAFAIFILVTIPYAIRNWLESR